MDSPTTVLPPQHMYCSLPNNRDLEWCWRTEQTLFSTVEMCQFSFRFFPMSFSPTKRVFGLVFFSLNSCRASMNLNQTFILAPGTVMYYICVYMHSMSSFAYIRHLKQSKNTFKPPVNGKWMCMWEQPCPTFHQEKAGWGLGTRLLHHSSVT